MTAPFRLRVREVDPPPNAAARVGHDAQPALEDRRHHGRVGPVPQEPAVAVASVVLVEGAAVARHEGGRRSCQRP